MSLNKLIKMLLPLGAISMFTACSLGGANDYHAEKLQPSAYEIQVPHSYDSTKMEQDYPIPNAGINKNELGLPSAKPPREIQ